MKVVLTKLTDGPMYGVVFFCHDFATARDTKFQSQHKLREFLPTLKVSPPALQAQGIRAIPLVFLLATVYNFSRFFNNLVDIFQRLIWGCFPKGIEYRLFSLFA